MAYDPSCRRCFGRRTIPCPINYGKVIPCPRCRSSTKVKNG